MGYPPDMEFKDGKLVKKKAPEPSEPAKPEPEPEPAEPTEPES